MRIRLHVLQTGFYPRSEYTPHGFVRQEDWYYFDTYPEGLSVLQLRPGGLTLNAAEVYELRFISGRDGYPREWSMLVNGSYQPFGGPFPRDNRWHIRTIPGDNWGARSRGHPFGRIRWRVVEPVLQTERDTLRKLDDIIHDLPNYPRGWEESGDDVRDQLVQLRREIALSLLGGI